VTGSSNDSAQTPKPEFFRSQMKQESSKSARESVAPTHARAWDRRITFLGASGFSVGVDWQLEGRRIA
jgi:hypothetical protein